MPQNSGTPVPPSEPTKNSKIYTVAVVRLIKFKNFGRLIFWLKTPVYIGKIRERGVALIFAVLTRASLASKMLRIDTLGYGKNA